MENIDKKKECNESGSDDPSPPAVGTPNGFFHTTLPKVSPMENPGGDKQENGRV